MQIFSVAIPKGGVGKTTIAFHLAVALAQAGRRVLAIDMDPQANLSLCLQVENPNGSHELFTGATVAQLAQATNYANLKLIPATFAGNFIEVPQAKLLHALTVFREQLLLSDADTIILDCPPALSTLTLGALYACNQIIVPLETADLAFAGINALNEFIQANPALQGKSLRVIPSKYDKSKAAQRNALDSIKTTFPNCLPPVPLSVYIGECITRNQPVWDYRPSYLPGHEFKNNLLQFGA
jgi:chromosome partitioning protein